MSYSSQTKTEVMLPLMELFPTLQGEGAFSGQAAVFIRLGGCDVGCVWCDVKESWPLEAHPTEAVADIVAEASQYPARIAVVTGGEPLMHNCYPLTESLREADFQTHMETSGAHPLSGDWDWITFSPKKFMAPKPEVALAADELKVVVYNKSDLDWAQKWAKEVSDKCLLYVQPEWDRKEKVMPLIAEFIQSNPQWRLSVQSHKYIGLP